MAYQVGIDLGTTRAVAAVCRADGTAHVVPLEGPTGAVVSAVHLAADGTLLVGEAAARRTLSDPGRVVRDLTRRIGDGTPLLIGHQPVPAAEPAARFLARLVDDVARREGGVASRVAVTHPGSWGAHRVGALRAALAEQGLGSAVLVPEPVAAVRAAADQAGVVAVYDLGGGRFDASVVRHTAAGPVLAGPPEELGVSGADLDEIVFGHVRTALGAGWDALDPTAPDVLAAVADLRRECTAAKEALSRDTEVHVPVALPGLRTHVRLGRAEFEEMIRPAVEETLDALQRAIDAAGTTPAELAAVLVVGGSAQVPLVPQLLEEAFGRDVTVAADPIGAVATGAALLVGRPPRRAVPASDASRERPTAGPGTVPLVPVADGTSVLPVARPPKQARPFTLATPTAPPSRAGRVVLVGSAAALALAVLGGVVAFGAGRIGAGQEAGAVTPASVTGTSAPASSTAVPIVPTVQPPEPARPAEPPPSRRTRQAPPPLRETSTPPPATSVPPTTPPDPGGNETTAPPKTDPPADDGGDQNGTGDNGTGGSAENGFGDNAAGGGNAAGGTDDPAAGKGDGGAQADVADTPAAAVAPPAEAVADPGRTDSEQVG